MTEELQDIINKYRRMTLKELELQMAEDNHFEINKEGKTYQIEANIIWDDKKKGRIRVDIFTDHLKKQKWWQIWDRPVYTLLRSNQGLDEWINPRI